MRILVVEDEKNLNDIIVKKVIIFAMFNGDRMSFGTIDAFGKSRQDHGTY